MSDEPLVDVDGLRRHLADHLGEPTNGAFAVVRHVAGHSNETFFVTWGERDLVLRRPPAGAFLPTAHDVLREHRVLSGLEGRGVRAPKPVLACVDEGVLGVPFYLMERVPGDVLRTTLPPVYDHPAARQRLGEELVDALAEVHAVEWEGTPLAEVGKPTGYLDRQVRRWRRQLELTVGVTGDVRPVPELFEVADLLADRVPETPRTTMVHGDYKLDNVVVAPDAEVGVRVRAILDWEMATLGDPLADLGWMLSFWREPGDDATDLLTVTPRLTEAPGFRTRRELVARYEERSGRAVHHLPFYEALAVWKLAILLEGSFARHTLGVTDDPLFAEMEKGVPALARRARRTVDGVG